MASKGADKWASGAHTARFNKAATPKPAAAAAPRVSATPATPPKVMSPSPGGPAGGPPMPAPYRKQAAAQAFAEQSAKHNAAVKPAAPQPAPPSTPRQSFNTASMPPMSQSTSKGRSR